MATLEGLRVRLLQPLTNLNGQPGLPVGTIGVLGSRVWSEEDSDVYTFYPEGERAGASRTKWCVSDLQVTRVRTPVAAAGGAAGAH